MLTKYETQVALEKLRDARQVQRQETRRFNALVDTIMSRLLHEAAVNHMTAHDVAAHSGFTRQQVRNRMRALDLNPTHGKRLLAETAAKALTENAELMGVDPFAIMVGPLAYLPMGEALRQELTDNAVARVTEFPETDEAEVERLTEVFKAAWHSRDEYWRSAEGTGADSQSDRTQAGIRAVLEALS